MSRTNEYVESSLLPTAGAADRTGTRARFAPSHGPTPSAAVDAVDLDSPFTNGTADPDLPFRYAGQTVEIHGNGRIRVQ
jgi:hypothetical protein